jgi:MFS family permease
MAGYAVGFAALGLGIQAGLWGWITAGPFFTLLLGLRLLYGLVAGAINPAATAYIADTTDEQSRGKGMALLALAGGLGTIIGPVFGGALTVVGPVFPMYAAALLAVLAGVLAFARLPELPRAPRAAVVIPLRMLDRRVLPYLAGWVVMFGVFTGIQTIAAYFIADRYGIGDITSIQRTMMVALLGMAACTLVVQAVVLQKWQATPTTILGTGFALNAAALLLVALTPGVAAFYAGHALFGLSFGFTAPGLNAAGSLSVRPDEQGAVAGLLTSAPMIGMILGPIVCAAAYRAGPNLPFYGGTVLSILVLCWLVFLRVPDPHR